MHLAGLLGRKLTENAAFFAVQGRRTELCSKSVENVIARCKQSGDGNVQRFGRIGCEAYMVGAFAL